MNSLPELELTVRVYSSLLPTPSLYENDVWSLFDGVDLVSSDEAIESYDPVGDVVESFEQGDVLGEEDAK